MENEQNKPMQTPAPYAAGTGSVPVALDRDAFARMGYRERLALKKENPEVYKELRNEGRHLGPLCESKNTKKEKLYVLISSRSCPN